MNDLQVFENEKFGKVRTDVVNDNPMFCLIDVCSILGIGNPSDVKKRFRDGVVTIEVTDSIGRKQPASFISESNLYKVIFQSRKPEAEDFSEWVTSEVLPSIRKHGLYATDEAIDQIINNPDFGIKLLSQLKQERLEKEKAQNELLIAKPKVDVYDAFIDSTGTYSVADSAKMLKLPYGCVKLYEKLRAMNILGKDNSPFEEQVKEGRFIRVPVQKVINGEVETFPTTRVTPKGLEYISKRLGITK